MEAARLTYKWGRTRTSEALNARPRASAAPRSGPAWERGVEVTPRVWRAACTKTMRRMLLRSAPSTLAARQ